MVKIYGSSDDNICIGGDWEDEISAVSGDDEWMFIALSDGTLLRTNYDGCWRFSVLFKGSIPFTRIDAEAEDKSGSRPTGEPWYSDVLTFDGDIKWVAHGAGPGIVASKPIRTAR